jgi:hypothetical protein
MQRFQIQTLLDITETKQLRKEPDKEHQWQQQQNFTMLLQTIGLRVNPIYIGSPEVEIVDLNGYSFGEMFKGSHRVWTFEFAIEYDGGFTDELGRPEGLLVDDLHFVPMILGLEETVTIPIPIFNSRDTESKNILVYAV